MTALASIIRAQLSTGRPLRVTRALLEALDASENPRAPLSELEVTAWRAHGAAADRAERFENERDEAQARERVTLAVLDEVRIILGVPDGADVITHARRAATEIKERRDVHFANAERFAAMERERDEAKRNARAWADERAQARLERDEARAEVERLRATLEVERSHPLAASAVIREAEERGARWALRWTWDKAGAEIDAIRAAPGYRHPYPTDLEHARVTAFGTMRGHTGCMYPSGSKEVAARICAEARKAGEHG